MVLLLETRQSLNHGSEKLYTYHLPDVLVLSISTSILHKITIHISSFATKATSVHEDRAKGNEACMKPMKGVDDEKERVGEEWSS